MPEMKSLTLNDKTYDCFVDSVARSLASASAVIKSASGESVTLSDASDVNLHGLRIFGKTMQEGVPSPEAPVDLVSVGSDGSITVDVTSEREAQSMTVATPNGLPGVPVDSGGNYTDTNGQQWVCDEIDLDRGVYIQRVGVVELDGTNVRWKDGFFSSGSGEHYVFLGDETVNVNLGSMCSHATYEYTGQWEKGNYGASGAGLFQVITDLSLDEWKTYLIDKKSSGEPILLLYALLNYVETHLSSEELTAYKELHTYREPTTVSNNSGAYMEIEYVMDAKKYIDELFAGGILPATVE